MATSTQQVAELTRQLEALTHAQEDLKARNRVLDSIVRLTNRQNAEISQLQASSSGFWAASWKLAMCILLTEVDHQQAGPQALGRALKLQGCCQLSICWVMP